MRKSKGTFTAVVLFLIVLVVAVSVVGEIIVLPEPNPAQRHNGFIVSERAEPILERACFDCHSNATRWPWYSYVPPVSLLITIDVAEGREHLNYSEWDTLPPAKQLEAMQYTLEEIREGEMPLAMYLRAHPDARLSDADTALLTQDIAARYGEAATQPPPEEHGHE